jgi:hypothetical protein
LYYWLKTRIWHSCKKNKNKERECLCCLLFFNSLGSLLLAQKFLKTQQGRKQFFEPSQLLGELTQLDFKVSLFYPIKTECRMIKLPGPKAQCKDSCYTPVSMTVYSLL